MKVAQRAEDGGNVTVRTGTLNAEGVGQGQAFDRGRAGQSAAKGFDLSGAQMSDIGDGAGLDLAVFAIGFAEENGGGELRLGIAVTYMIT